jgi:outer membrane immunogenic protein
MILRGVKVLTLGLLVSTALGGMAAAADVEAPYQHDWTGLYVGGHIGYGEIDLNGEFDNTEADPGETFEDGAGSFDLDDNGLIGGAQIGYNVQIDSLVLGVEADLSFVDWKDKVANADDERVSFDTDYLFTFRARAGFAIDNILLFATAGAAWTDTTYEANRDVDDTDPGEEGDVDLDDVGLAVGGGAEYAFDEDWSIKAEALYVMFNDKENTATLTNGSEIGDFIELDDLFVVRVGVNFHL